MADNPKKTPQKKPDLIPLSEPLRKSPNPDRFVPSPPPKPKPQPKK